MEASTARKRPKHRLSLLADRNHQVLIILHTVDGQLYRLIARRHIWHYHRELVEAYAIANHGRKHQVRGDTSDPHFNRQRDGRILRRDCARRYGRIRGAASDRLNDDGIAGLHGRHRRSPDSVRAADE